MLRADKNVANFVCLRSDAYDGHGLRKDIQQLLIPAG